MRLQTRTIQCLAAFLLSAFTLAANAAAPNPTPGPEVYAARRAKLIERLPAGAMVVINSESEKAEPLYSFRQDSNFWYMTGLPEQGAIALIVPGAAAGQRYTLYTQPKAWAKEQWTGYLAGQDGAKTMYGADAAFPTDDFAKQMLELMRDATSLWLYDAGDMKFRDQVLATWNRRAGNSTVALPVYNLKPTIADLRLYKDATEVALLREAVDLSVKAHLAAMPLAQPGKGEWELRGAMVGTCLAGAAARMAYPAIVGSGKNSVVLHYDAADQRMQKGAMIVNDTACEYGMYAADVTRSYPVGGSFSPEQKAIYDIVLAAQNAAHAKAKVGAKFHELHDATAEVVVDGLLKLGLLKGDRAEILKSRSYRSLYPHGSSHWIGLDVHDAGSYETARPDKNAPPHLRNYAPQQAVLKPGMAFTIEPGIYIPEKAEGIDPKWWNIGVRIEDDYLVTPTGTECMSCALPRTTAEVEKLVRAGAKR